MKTKYFLLPFLFLLTSCNNNSITHNKKHSFGKQPLLWVEEIEEGILYTTISETDYERVTVLVKYFDVNMNEMDLKLLIQWHNVKQKEYNYYLDTNLIEKTNIFSYQYEMMMWATTEELDVYMDR